MVSFIQGVYVALRTALKGPLSSYSLFALLVFPVCSFASTLSNTFVQHSGTSGVYTVHWNCTGYYCNIYNNGSMMGGSHQGSGSYNVTVANNATHTVKMDSYSYNPYGGSSLIETDNMWIEYHAPAPAVPTNFQLPASSNTGTFPLTWNVSANTTYYEVLERVNGAAAVVIASPTTNSYTRTGRGNGTYSYTVRACNTLSCSYIADYKNIDVAITPGVPSSISAPTLHDGDFTVSWGTASGSVTAYDLDRSINGASYTNAYDGSALSFSYSNLGAATYTFRVRACRTTGSYTSCSGWRTSSNSVAAVPSSAPASFSVPTSDSDGAYSVSWGTISNTNTYELQERTGTGTWATIQNTSATSKSISGKGNNTYGYQVRACNDLGCSAYATEKRVDVAIAPGVPTSISAPALHDGDFTVSWGAASGSVTAYDLDQNINGGSYTNVYDGTATSKVFTNLSAGTYVYRVRACRTTGSYTNCSGWRTSSNSVAAVPSSVPASFSVPASDGDGVYSVSWGTVTNAYSYELQERTGTGAWSTIQSTSAVSAQIIGKVSNTYGYQVRACNDLGCGAFTTEKRVDVAIAPSTPTSITATYQGSGQVLLQWSVSSGANRYQVYKSSDAGGTFPTSEYVGASTSKTTSIENQTYAYRVQACRVTGSYTNCSGWKTSSTISRPAHEISVTQNYTYDPLGRLTFVEDSRAGMNRDYDYDRAGNRTNVSVGSTSETQSEPGYPSEPRNLSSVYSGNCYFNVSWTVPVRTTSDTYYILVDSGNNQTQTTQTNLLFYCQYNTSPPNIKPISLKACNSAGCSYSVNFNY